MKDRTHKSHTEERQKPGVFTCDLFEYLEIYGADVSSPGVSGVPGSAESLQNLQQNFTGVQVVSSPVTAERLLPVCPAENSGEERVWPTGIRLSGVCLEPALHTLAEFYRSVQVRHHWDRILGSSSPLLTAFVYSRGAPLVPYPPWFSAAGLNLENILFIESPSLSHTVATVCLEDTFQAVVVWDQEGGKRKKIILSHARRWVSQHNYSLEKPMVVKGDDLENCPCYKLFLLVV